MISQLTGTISHTEPGLIILQVGGVGYAINVAKDTGAGLHIDNTLTLWTHLAVRETSMELFGFGTRDELSLFEMLLVVPGIGPRSALAVLSLASADTLRKAISEENITYLTKVSGIGKKTAQRIVITLKDRLGSKGELSGELKEDADVIEVLVSLGYSQTEARDTVKKIDPTKNGTNERTKEALKILGSRL